MKHSAFVVTVSVAGVQDSQIWDSDQPLQIGHPFRWVMERTASGVSIRNVEAQASREIADSAIAKGTCVELPEAKGERSHFELEIRPVAYLPPAFSTHEGESGELRVYALRGRWTRESSGLEQPYHGYLGDKHAFTIRRRGDDYSIKSYVNDLELNGEARFEKGMELPFTEAELVGATLRIGEFQWKLDTLRRTVAPPLALVGEEITLENAAFRRSLRNTFVGIAAFLLVAILWPRTPETPKAPDVPPQFTKLLFKQPVKSFMTSAPSGNYAAVDKQAGEHKKAKAPLHVGVQKVAKSTPNKAPAAPVKHLVEAPTPKAPAPKHVVAAVKHDTRSPKKAPPGPVSKSPKLARSANPGPAKRIARSAPNPHPVSTNQHEERNTPLAKMMAGTGLRANSRALVNGGMTQLLGSSGFAKGSDAHSEANGLLSSRSALDAAGGAPGGGGGGGSLGARHVTVASLGGGAGLFGDKGVGYGKGSHAIVNGQGKSFVTMDTGASDVDEGLTKEQVGRVIHQHMSEIRYCYESAKLRNSDTEGKLAVRFTISGGGSVLSSGVNQSTLDDSSLDNCVMSRLSGWRFPHPRGGVNVAVTYPFIFKTLGR